jgi:hypothetical protein
VDRVVYIILFIAMSGVERDHDLGKIMNSVHLKEKEKLS